MELKEFKELFGESLPGMVKFTLKSNPVVLLDLPTESLHQDVLLLAKHAGKCIKYAVVLSTELKPEHFEGLKKWFDGWTVNGFSTINHNELNIEIDIHKLKIEFFINQSMGQANPTQAFVNQIFGT